LTTRAAAVAALMMILAVGTVACSPSGQSASPEQGKFAGLDAQILQWRQDILATDPLCRSQAEGEKCESFEVACKGERALTPADPANGVTARVVAAMSWNGFDSKFKHGQSGMRAAEFAKGKAGWTRSDHKPVNPSSCADL
jgi:hypothetical protein